MLTTVVIAEWWFTHIDCFHEKGYLCVPETILCPYALSFLLLFSVAASLTDSLVVSLRLVQQDCVTPIQVYVCFSLHLNR